MSNRLWPAPNRHYTNGSKIQPTRGPRENCTFTRVCRLGNLEICRLGYPSKPQFPCGPVKQTKISTICTKVHTFDPKNHKCAQNPAANWHFSDLGLSINYITQKLAILDTSPLPHIKDFVKILIELIMDHCPLGITKFMGGPFPYFRYWIFGIKWFVHSY